MYEQLFNLHANLLKAIANPRRLEIINLLREHEMNVSQMQEMLHLPQANLSQHLMILRDQKVVTKRKEGKEIFYKLTDERILKACDLCREVLIDRHEIDKFKTDELLENMNHLIPVVIDPVCKMRLSTKTASFAHLHKNENYYFCASGCLETFKNSPEKFIHKLNKKQ